MLNKILYKTGIATILAGTIFMSGCSDNPDASRIPLENGGDVSVRFTLSSRYNGAGTRADGIPIEPENDNERINDWFLVFTDSQGMVRKILERKDAVADPGVAVEEETFTCILPTGTYSIYAFANISRTELAAATITPGQPGSGLVFSENSGVDFGEVSKRIWKGLNDTDGAVKVESVTELGEGRDAKVTTPSNDNLNLWDAGETGKPIPMTGYLGSVRVENTIEEVFAIEVVRMVAKVELQMLTPGDRKITVNGVAFSPVTVTPVSLFPMGAAGISYSFLGEEAYTQLADAEYARLRYSFGTGLEVSAATVENGIRKSGEGSCSFYMKESLSYPTGGFTVWLDVTYEDGVNEFMQYNPTVDIRGYINRNDWIRIPITLSEYDVRAEAIFYPPIGGYPAINESVDADGSQEFTFGTQGKFAIMPYVTDKLTGEPLGSGRYIPEVSEIRYEAKENGKENWRNVDWSNAEVIYENSAPKGDDKGIFTTLPVKVEKTSTALPFEMLGELNTEEGIARVTLKVKVYADSYTDGATPKHTYTRTLYIIRDNADITGENNNDNP